MEKVSSYVPLDRLQSIVDGVPLPEEAAGTLLFADLSGYTALVNAIVQEMGANRGVDELTDHINRFFGAFIDAVHQENGSVMAFGGDAITAWFADDNGLRAIACGLDIVKTIDDIGLIEIEDVEPVLVGVKVAVAAGTVRRLRVGDPAIRILDIVTGEASLALNDVIDEGGKDPPTLLVHKRVADALETVLETEEWSKDKSDSQTPTAEVDSQPTHVYVRGVCDKAAVPQESAALEAANNVDPDQLRPWLL